jgi:hypothetical protein
MKLSKREWERMGPLLLPLGMGGSRRLPPKLATKALLLGLIEPCKERFYGSGKGAIDRIPVIVTGHQFTTMGHAQYCEWAAQQEVGE